MGSWGPESFHVFHTAEEQQSQDSSSGSLALQASLVIPGKYCVTWGLKRPSGHYCQCTGRYRDTHDREGTHRRQQGDAGGGSAGNSTFPLHRGPNSHIRFLDGFTVTGSSQPNPCQSPCSPHNGNLKSRAQMPLHQQAGIPLSREPRG